jgi:hypothetical protein
LDEEETWNILDSLSLDSINYLLGNFNEDADSSTHFELSFEFIDCYKNISHNVENFPEFTNIINQERSTWILSKENVESGILEIDTFTNGVWIDVRN